MHATVTQRRTSSGPRSWTSLSAREGEKETDLRTAAIRARRVPLRNTYNNTCKPQQVSAVMSAVEAQQSQITLAPLRARRLAGRELGDPSLSRSPQCLLSPEAEAIGANVERIRGR
ncbi:hypothetical protein MTO96_022265 [Rhipicephalus appendiculatus]